MIINENIYIFVHKTETVGEGNVARMCEFLEHPFYYAHTGVVAYPYYAGAEIRRFSENHLWFVQSAFGVDVLLQNEVHAAHNAVERCGIHVAVTY